MISSVLYAQLAPKEIAGFEYTMLPDINNTEIREFGIKVNQECKLGLGQLNLGLEYLDRSFSFFNINGLEDLQDIERTHRLTLTIDYKKMIWENWGFNVKIAPTMDSTLKQSVGSEDLLLNMDGLVSLNWSGVKTISKFDFGISYNTYLGQPQFLPIINYNLLIEDKWNISLGFPETRLERKINERNIISTNASASGSYSNVSSSILFNGIDSLTNTKLVFNDFDFGLEYLYRIQPNFTASMKSGYSLVENFNIQDKEDEIRYNFEPNGSIYFSMGLKYNLK